MSAGFQVPTLIMLEMSRPPNLMKHWNLHFISLKLLMVSLRLNSNLALELIFLPWYIPRQQSPLFELSAAKCVLDIMLALGHIGYRKHYTAYSKRSSDCQDFHQKSLSPPFFLSSHPKNSEFWHQERKTLSWIQRGNMLFEKCMLCVLERQTRSFLAFKGKITLALLSYCLGSLAVQQLPLPAGNNSSQGAFFLIHQFVSFSDKIMPLYSMMPPINKYPKPCSNYCNLFCYSLNTKES